MAAVVQSVSIIDSCKSAWSLIGQIWVGGTRTIFSLPLFPHFLNDQNNGYLHNTIFIFAKCHNSWGVETPVWYEHGWKYSTYTFAKFKFPIMEKLTNRALVTPLWVLPEVPWNSKDIDAKISKSLTSNPRGCTMCTVNASSSLVLLKYQMYPYPSGLFHCNKATLKTKCR